MTIHLVNLANGRELVSCSFFLALPLVVNTMELQTHGALTSRTATMQVSGPNRAPLLIFNSSNSSVTCTAFRCRYEGWRDDLGKASEVSIDEKGRVAQIQVEGRLRLKPEDLQQRVNQGFALALLLVTAGLGMCVRAWQVNQLSK